MQLSNARLGKNSLKIFVGNRSSFAKPFLDQKLEIDLVITSKGSHLDQFALLNGIETTYYESKQSFLEKIGKTEFTYLFSAGCPYLIPEKILNDDARIFLNIHPSYLPLYPGRHAITEALYKGGPFGATLHTMGATADSGHLIYQEELSMNQSLKTTQKFQEIFQFEEKLVRKCIDSGLLTKGTSYFNDLPLINSKDTGFIRDDNFRRISPDLSKEEAQRRISSLSVIGHMSFIETDDKRFYISDFLDPSRLGNSTIRNQTLNYNFTNGPLILIIYSEDSGAKMN